MNDVGIALLILFVGNLLQGVLVWWYDRKYSLIHAAIVEHKRYTYAHDNERTCDVRLYRQLE